MKLATNVAAEARPEEEEEEEAEEWEEFTVDRFLCLIRILFDGEYHGSKFCRTYESTLLVVMMNELTLR